MFTHLHRSPLASGVVRSDLTTSHLTRFGMIKAYFGRKKLLEENQIKLMRNMSSQRNEVKCMNLSSIGFHKNFHDMAKSVGIGLAQGQLFLTPVKHTPSFQAPSAEQKTQGSSARVQGVQCAGQPSRQRLRKPDT